MRAAGLTVNGTVSPLGVDPDDAFFAWTVQSNPRQRQVLQTAYRIVVRRTDPGPSAVVWDSGSQETGQQAFVAYGGSPLAADAAYAWTVQLRDTGGRWGPVAAPATFTTALRAADWQARWLRPAGPSQQPDRVTYLRTEVTPPAGSLRRATAYVSAAHTYRLYLNGPQVDAWPSFSYPDEQYARAVDVTSVVRPGRPNALGVLHRWYGPGQGRPASAPGLLLQLSLWYADGRHVVYGTDGSWRERPAEWLPSPQRNSDVGDFVEWVDGRDYPQGWSSAGYDATDWSAVTVIGPAGFAPFTRTYAQRTHIEERPVLPVRLDALVDGSVVADFGAVYAARPRVEFASGVPGQTVTVRGGYLLGPDGQVSTLHGTQETNLSSTYIMRAGAQAFEVFTYFGFRYLQVQGAGQLLGRDQVLALARHTSMPEVAGRHLLDRRPHARCRVALVRALLPLLQPGAVRRHADTGEGPVHLGRRQRVGGGDAGLRRAESELAGLARRGPGPGPVLAGRAHQRRLPQRGRGAVLRHLQRAIRRVALAVLRVDRGPPHGDPLVPVGSQGGSVVVVGTPSLDGPALRAGRHQQR